MLYKALERGGLAGERCFNRDDPTDGCTDQPGDLDAWPYDINMDTWADVGDVLEFKPVIVTPVPPTSTRYNLNMDRFIDVGDVLEYKPVIMTQCTNP